MVRSGRAAIYGLIFGTSAVWAAEGASFPERPIIAAYCTDPGPLCGQLVQSLAHHAPRHRVRLNPSQMPTDATWVKLTQAEGRARLEWGAAGHTGRTGPTLPAPDATLRAVTEARQLTDKLLRVTPGLATHLANT